MAEGYSSDEIFQIQCNRHQFMQWLENQPDTDFVAHAKSASLIAYDFQAGRKHFINGFEYEVYPATVGQYTGLTDKNGKKIFEGDIVKWDAKDELFPAIVGYVYFDAQELAWMVRWQQYDTDFLAELDMPCVSIVGNIHDNPELVGVE